MGLDLMELILRLPTVLFALTVHECMHAWVAYKCGDDTAYRAGRVTLNPLAHLDPLGTLMLLIGPIGWAKPVPVDPTNFGYETRRRDEILVSGAGVAANFVLGALCALVLRFFSNAILQWEDVGSILWQLIFYGSFINFALAIFNLLPVFPLDGSHILQNLLPLNAAIRYVHWRRHSAYVLVAFILANRLLVDVVGFSLLGYPVMQLFNAFSGFEL